MMIRFIFPISLFVASVLGGHNDNGIHDLLGPRTCPITLTVNKDKFGNDLATCHPKPHCKNDFACCHQTCLPKYMMCPAFSYVHHSKQPLTPCKCTSNCKHGHVCCGTRLYGNICLNPDEYDYNEKTSSESHDTPCSDPKAYKHCYDLKGCRRNKDCKNHKEGDFCCKSQGCEHGICVHKKHHDKPKSDSDSSEERPQCPSPCQLPCKGYDRCDHKEKCKGKWERCCESSGCEHKICVDTRKDPHSGSKSGYEGSGRIKPVDDYGKGPHHGGPKSGYEGSGPVKPGNNYEHHDKPKSDSDSSEERPKCPSPCHLPCKGYKPCDHNNKCKGKGERCCESSGCEHKICVDTRKVPHHSGYLPNHEDHGKHDKDYVPSHNDVSYHEVPPPQSYGTPPKHPQPDQGYAQPKVEEPKGYVAPHPPQGQDYGKPPVQQHY